MCNDGINSSNLGKHIIMITKSIQGGPGFYTSAAIRRAHKGISDPPQQIGYSTFQPVYVTVHKPSDLAILISATRQRSVRITLVFYSWVITRPTTGITRVLLSWLTGHSRMHAHEVQFIFRATTFSEHWISQSRVPESCVRRLLLATRQCNKCCNTPKGHVVFFYITGRNDQRMEI